MIFIKYVLIFLIFGVFTSIGNIYSKKYENRLRELEKMQNLLNIFKAKIKFTGQNIQEIFKQIYIDNKDNIEMAKACGWNTCMAFGYELDKIKNSVNKFLNEN